MDLAIALAFAIIVGRSLQVFADSGEVITEKVIYSVLVAAGSYLLSALPFLFSRRLKNTVPSWIWIGVVGSFVYGFSRFVVVFTITNLGANGELASLDQALAMAVGQLGSFVIISLVLSCILVPLLIFSRILGVAIETLFSRPNDLE